MLKAELLFGSNMVLQRDKPVAIWGTATPGARITVRMQEKVAIATTDPCGNWNALCGPYSLSFDEQMEIDDGEEHLRFTNVQVGEVYLAGGQSNMEFHMRYDQDYAAEKEICKNPNIRFFDYPEVSYLGQLNERNYLKHYGFWRVAEPDQLERFSAVSYYFAKDIQNTLNVPVGIVGCNWGGTPAAAWMSCAAIRTGGGSLLLDEYAQIEQALDLDAYERWFQTDSASWRIDQLGSPITDVLMLGGTDEEIIRNFAAIGLDMSHAKPEDFKPVIGPKHERRPAGLYESMLCQVAPYTIRGFLWYQGETDGDTHPELYDTLFPALIREWRDLWGENLPFLFVQLAPLGQWLDCIGENYVRIRDAQQHTANTVEGTGMAVISDIGAKNDVHPKKKQPVGHRLALLAMNQIYGLPTLCEAPTLEHVLVEDGRLTLSFSNTGNGLYLADRTPDGYTADAKKFGGLQVFQAGKLLPTDSLSASAEGNMVKIIGENISRKQDTLVKIAKTGWYRVNLYNSAGIPARPAEYVSN